MKISRVIIKNVIISFSILLLLSIGILNTTKAFAEDNGLGSQGSVGFFGEYEELTSDPGPNPQPEPELKEPEKESPSQTSISMKPDYASSSSLFPKTGEVVGNSVLWGILILALLIIMLLNRKRREGEEK